MRSFRRLERRGKAVRTRYGDWLTGTPPNKSLDLDRGRILSFRGMLWLQRPRQVSFVDYEAVGKSTHIQYIFPVSDTSLSISETVFCGPRAHPVGVFAQQREASGGPGGGNEPPGRGTDAAKS